LFLRTEVKMRGERARTTQIWRFVRLALQVPAVSLACALVGSGIGFLEGEIVGRNWPRGAQVGFAEGAAGIGAVVAAILGPLLHLLLGCRTSFLQFSVVASSAAIGAGLFALIGEEVAAPVAAVFFAIAAALLTRAGAKEKAGEEGLK
jgi:hypothetical protein